MEPIRTCLGCRGRDLQSVLLRLVRLGDQVVDASSPRLPGRGSYLHQSAACFELAQRRRALVRVFGTASLSPELSAKMAGWN